MLRTRIDNRTLPHPSTAVVLMYEYEGVPKQIVPFTYDRQTGVLDFDFSGSFNETGTIRSNDTAYVQGASFGAVHLVNDIGPNIVAWLENNGADTGSVRIHEKPIVVRTNQIAIGREPNDDQTFAESSTPFAFDDVSGSISNNWNATYLFRKPLVVTYTKTTEGTSRYYRMFNTQFEGNV